VDLRKLLPDYCDRLRDLASLSARSSVVFIGKFLDGPGIVWQNANPDSQLLADKFDTQGGYLW
jgi:hypothetical protein